ncbi:MAG: cation:proton antiporter [Chloroflexota bacterium]
MEILTIYLIYIASFAIIALASKQIGHYFRQLNLPLITGFLLTGIITGPFLLNLISVGAISNLRFIDEIALAMIAFAAGNELFLKEVKDRLMSIAWVTSGLVLATFTLSSLTIFVLADYIPFMQSMSATSRFAVAILGGAVLVARSPSSAIAVVNELRAKGPFTKTALGVTIIMDVVVILLFGLSSSVADALLTGLHFDIGFIGLLIFELVSSTTIGYAVFKMIQAILAGSLAKYSKSGAIVLLGYFVFLSSATIRTISHDNLPFEILLEPLLICMIAGFLITNFSIHRDEFSKILHEISPAIYILFFTLTGASLSLDIFIKTWPIALALFAIRLISIFIGSFVGGSIAGDPNRHNRIAWMAFVTQAGVGLGLAKEISDEFPLWGDSFATVLISVIILNQLVGPPLFKWAINLVGESRSRAKTMEFDGVRDVIILGLKAQSVSLARQLLSHNWQVKLVCTEADCKENPIAPDIDTHVVNEITLAEMQKIDAKHADAMVSFLPDEKSYQVCELFYEHFGTETMVVRLKNRTDFDRFHKLGVLVVEPQTAVLSLLEHFVRSSVGTSLLLGMGDGQEMIDLEIRDPSLHGVALRDLRLPLDVLVLSVQRNKHTLVSRGFLKFKLGDIITAVGPMEQLERLKLRFDAPPTR